MNTKFLSLLKLVVTATVISLTAGCATAQTVFAPGLVAQAKAAGSQAIAANNDGALVPGSVDLGISNSYPQASYNGALVPGSVDLGISSARRGSFNNSALIPGSVDLGFSSDQAASFYNGALIPGSVDLLIAR